MTSFIFNQFVVPCLIAGYLYWVCVSIGIRWKRGGQVSANMKLLSIFRMVGALVLTILLIVEGMKRFM